MLAQLRAEGRMLAQHCCPAAKARLPPACPAMLAQVWAGERMLA